jgi:hypothetical protein
MGFAEGLKPIRENFFQFPYSQSSTHMMTVQFPSPVGRRTGGKV